MSLHCEWATIDSMNEIVAPGEFTDEHGTVNDEYAVLAGTDSALVLEGTLDQIERAALGLLQAVAEHRAKAS